MIAGVTGATADAGSGTLTNTGGQVSGQAVVIGGQVANNSGVISGLHSVSMNTRAVDNDAGVIEAGAGGISINTGGAALTNTNSGTTRGIVSTGAITIANAGAIDNQSGYIGANGGLNITGSASIDNRQGALLGLGTSSVHTTGLLNNQGGSIKSNSSLAIGAGTLDNSGANSVVFANGDLTVTAGHIDNSNTKNGAFTTGLLAAGNLSVTAATVNNANGAIVSLGDTSVKATTSLNNTGGQIAGNTVTIDTPVLVNTGGRADAQERLALKVPQFSADGTLASNGALELHLQGDYTNNGTVSSNGDLVISTTGTYTNYKDISAKENLYLSAAALHNGIEGVIGSKKTTITATGEVVNEGLINSTAQVTTINAASVRNVGKIYGDHINLSAAMVQNGANAKGIGAAIASRLGSVAIYGSLVNTGDSLVYSSGSLNVHGAVTNVGASLNAQGNIEITGHLDNRNAGFVTGLQTTSEPASGVWITPSGSTQRYSTAELGWRGDTGGRWVLPSTTYPFSAFGAAFLLPVANCYSDNDGYSCYGYNYTTSDPVWARFGVGSPDSVPGPGPAPRANGCITSGDGWDSRDMEGGCSAWWAAVDTHTATVLSRYSQLETAITAFNADLEARSLIDWYETTLTGKTVVKTYVVDSDPGIVLAGGNISLPGGNTNQDSRIYAGGNYIGFLPTATYGTSQTTEEGSMVFSHRTWSGGFSQSYGRQVSAAQPIAFPPTTESIKLDVRATPAPYLAQTTTPLGAGAATVPTVGAVVTSARNAAGVDAQSATTHTDAPTTHIGSAVTVATTTTDAPQTSSGSTPVSSGTGDTVAPLTGSGPTPVTGEALTTAVNAAPTPVLPGSVIAATVRADQLASISTSLAKFAVLAAAAPQVAQAVNTGPRQAGLPPVKEAGYTTVKSASFVLAPNNQLYNLNRGPRGPLVETDPAFTGYRNFISSAWFLAQLNIDPERTMKLYGDGFAEQRLIDDQVMALTGRRFLSNYTSSEDQYQDLLNAGVMFAQKFQLTPGVALSAEQMAALTTDIVWLEMRTVSLPDGSTAEVLTPTVYLRRPVDGDITPVGSLVSARNITVRSAGDVMNSGTAYAWGDAAKGDGTLTIVGQNVGNTGTLAGNAITITAQNNIDNAGGVIQGLGNASTVALNARDISLRTTTQTNVAQIEGPNGISTGIGTNVDRIATVSADSVTMKALGDITLSGAVVKATGALTVSATGSFTAQAVETGYTLDVPVGGYAFDRAGYYTADAIAHQLTQLSANNAALAAGGSAIFTGANVNATGNTSVTARSITIEGVTESQSVEQQGVHKKGYEQAASTDETLVVTGFTAGRNLTLTANGVPDGEGSGDIKLSGATLQAGALASLNATHDIIITDRTATDTTGHEGYSRGSALLGLVSTSNNSTAGSTTIDSTGSSIKAGGSLSVVAGNDLGIKGSDLAGREGVLLDAGGRVLIVPGHDTSGTHLSIDTSRSGLAGSFAGIPIPASALDSADVSRTSDRVTGSSITSESGGVRIAGGGIVTLIGVDITAAQDITVKGSEVKIGGAVGSDITTTATDTKGTDIGMLGFAKGGHGFGARASTDSTTIDASLTRSTLTGRNVTVIADGLNGGSGDVDLGPATFNATGTVSFSATGVLAMQVETARDIETYATTNKDLVWQKVTDSGSIVDESHMTRINAGTLVVNANKVEVQVPVAGTGSVQATLQALATQPGMEWITQLQNDPALQGKIDWKRIEEIHNNWNYSQSGLTAAGAVIVTLVVAYLTAGAGANLAAALGVSSTATVSVAVLQAGITTLATQASIALINNNGDIGKALHDLGSSANVKGLVTALLTAGVLSTINPLLTQPGNQVGGEFVAKLQTNLTGGLAKAVISSAINGTSLEEGLKVAIKGAIIDSAAASSANWIGSNTEGFANKVAHLIAGCAAGVVRTGDGADCSAGAIGAVVGELAAEIYGESADTIEFASLMAGAAVAISGGDADQITLGATAGGNAAANNYLSPRQKDNAKNELAACERSIAASLCTATVYAKYLGISASQDAGFIAGFGAGIGIQGAELVLSAAQLLANLPQALDALKTIVSDPEFISKAGGALADDYRTRLSTLNQAYNDAGWDGAVTAGVETGRLLFDVIAMGSAALDLGKFTAKVAATGSSVLVDAARLQAVLAADAFKSLDAATTARWAAETASWRAATTELAIMELQAGSKSHPLLRHGDQVELSQLQTRALTGLTPDGILGDIVNATRWLDNSDMLSAIKKAQQIFAETGGRSIKYVADAGKVIGEGFYQNSTRYQQTSKFIIILDATGLPKTAYPILP